MGNFHKKVMDFVKIGHEKVMEFHFPQGAETLYNVTDFIVGHQHSLEDQ